jgi:hypothetical protein
MTICPEKREQEGASCVNSLSGDLRTICVHVREDGGGFRGERYVCDRCSFTYFLDYDEMR